MHIGRHFSVLLAIGMAAVPVPTGAAFADQSEANSTTIAPAQAGQAAASSPTASQPAETVITIKSQVQPKQIPQSKASQTMVSAPQIENANPSATLPDIIARYVPGASSNPDNGLRIRGADDQFSTYIDGVPMPQSVSGTITDVFDPKDIRTLRVYTGGYPAELGGQLSGVFDITTKTGEGKPEGTVEQSVATQGTYNTQANVEGGAGKFGYFASASGRQTDFFLNPPTESATHDWGREDHGFLKLDYNSSPSDKVIVEFGANGSNFEIPSTQDVQQETGNVADIVWRRTNGSDISRLSFYTHTSTLVYQGSPSDVAYEGLLDTNQNLKATYVGIRGDQSWAGGPSHEFKVGFDVSKATVDENFVIELQPTGILTDFDTPHAWEIGLYAQEDWTTGRFLINYGARFDESSQDVTKNSVSPRVNVKYRLTNSDTLHAYYDKLFQPIAVEDAAHLVGNSGAQDNGTNTPILPETDQFYEFGIDHAGHGFSLGALAYYKWGINVRDDDQVGDTNIFLPVNDAAAYFNGFEFTAGRDFSPSLHGFSNLALSWNKNKGPVTGGLNEGGTGTNYFFDDHDQTYTSTLGVAYDHRGVFANLTGQYGSGQPYGEIDDANGNPTALNYLRVPPHLTFDADAGKKFAKVFEASVFVDNMFNDAYIIKEVTTLSNAQYAEGRVIGVKLSQDF